MTALNPPPKEQQYLTAIRRQTLPYDLQTIYVPTEPALPQCCINSTTAFQQGDNKLKWLDSELCFNKLDECELEEDILKNFFYQESYYGQPDPALCPTIETVQALSNWDPNHQAPLDWVVQCNYKLSDIVQLDNEQLTRFVDTYRRVFTTSPEFTDQNTLVLEKTLFQFVCFRISEHCRYDSNYLSGNASDYLPKAACSMINSAEPLGVECFNWYRNHYTTQMQQQIVYFCATSQQNGNPQDCVCVNRINDPVYRATKTVIDPKIDDACWYKPCAPDSAQLKASGNMFTPVCATVACSAVADIQGVDDSQVKQYVNCSNLTATSESYTAQSSSAFLAFILLLIIVVVLIFIIIFSSLT